MTTITAALVKELRERTSAGMMECKKALEATNGDIEKAVEELRKSGRTKADKKAGRIAAEGVITIVEDGKRVAMAEINTETDFVARDENVITFVTPLMQTVLKHQEQDVEKLSALTLEGQSKTVEEARKDLVSKVGENVQVRRIVISETEAGIIGTYLHGNRIGVIVELDTDNKELARDIAMHIAASKPLVVAPENVPEEVIAKEKEIYMAQAATSGKPQDIIEKMVEGRLKKFLNEISLTGQPFVRDPDVTVGNLLNKHRAKVLSFYRFEVGEGIEKVSEDFKEAVMSQMQGS